MQPCSTTELYICREPYDDDTKEWLGRSGHYLKNPPPGCLFCVVVRRGAPDLFGGIMATGPRLGLCLVGRPVARMLPQDGSVGEITRMVLLPGLPHGTASRVLVVAADHARARGMTSLIAYHDRTRHTGCIYRKAGFRKDGGTSAAAGKGWGSRGGRTSSTYEATPKRRWRLQLTETSAALY